jgi:nucleoside-diphosphate-sugar epimerase
MRCDKEDFHWTIVRPCHIYGPGSQLGCLQAHARDSQLIRRLLTREPLKLVGGGFFLQQPIFARDLSQLILDMAGNSKTYGEIFCAAGPDVVESWKYYALIAGILGVDLKVDEIPVRKFLGDHPEALPYMCHRIYDLSKLIRCGLLPPSTPLNLGLQEHVASLISNGQV